MVATIIIASINHCGYKCMDFLYDAMKKRYYFKNGMNTQDITQKL
jgi:hypothetical protein